MFSFVRAELQLEIGVGERPRHQRLELLLSCTVDLVIPMRVKP